MTIAKCVVTAAVLAALVTGCGSRTTPAAVRDSSVVATTSATATSASDAPLDLASPAVPANDSEQARKTEATKIAHDLVGRAALPPGASKVIAPPGVMLSNAPESEVTSRMAVDHLFFTVPGDVDQVLAFASQHAPPGFTNDGGNGSFSGPEGSSKSIQLTGVSTPDFEEPWLMVAAEQEGGSVGVRVDTQVVWLPVRTAAETLPKTGASATLASTLWGATVSSTSAIALGSAESSRLAAILNALPTRSDAKHGCPAIAWMATLTFATTPSTVVSVDSCGVGVTVGGVDQPALAYDGTLTNAVEQLLGLPMQSLQPAVSTPAPPPAASS